MTSESAAAKELREREEAELPGAMRALASVSEDAPELVRMLNQAADLLERTQPSSAVEQEPVAWRWKEDGRWEYHERAPLHPAASNIEPLYAFPWGEPEKAREGK